MMETVKTVKSPQSSRDSVPVAMESVKSAQSSRDSAPVAMESVKSNDTVVEAHSNQNELFQEASHVKLRSTTVQKEKSLEPCSSYELDMKATTFGLCMCGHPKQEHAHAAPVAAQFQTSAATRRNSVMAATRPAVVVERTLEPSRGNQYPALEPCENYQVDVSASSFGMCVCGHQKATHASTNPAAAGGDKMRQNSNRNVLQTQQEPVLAEKRSSGDGASGSFKPPPPARRPSVLSNQGSSSSKSLVTTTPQEEVKAGNEKVLERKASEKIDQAAPPPVVDAERERHRARLVDFYTAYNPEKIGEIDTILDKFKGKEQTLFKKLKEKYPDAEV